MGIKMEQKVMVEDSKAMRIWLSELNTKSSSTKEVYLIYFNTFMERWNIPNAEELYEMRRTDLESDDTRDHQRIERMVKTLMAEMRQSGKSASTCKQVGKSLSSFFDTQGMPLTLKSKDLPKGASNGQRLALVQHIKDMWDYSPTETKLKTRAQLMFLKDSGLRISDLANLNMGDYIEAETIEYRGQPYKKFWPTETQKMAVTAFIHVGPETVEAVEEYLKERREEGQTMDPESPLFLNRFGERFSAPSIGMVFNRIGKRIGKKLSAHSLRKFHKTTLEGAGVAEQWIKKLQGKAADVYSRPEESGDLTEAYIKAYDALRVFDGGVDAEKLEEQAEEIEKLREVNEALRQKLEDQIEAQKLDQRSFIAWQQKQEKELQDLKKQFMDYIKKQK